MKFLRLLARIRYWRSRALRAEHKWIELHAQAEAERWRNQGREDTFVSAAVMGGRGMMGVPPRYGPAETMQPIQSRLTTVSDPMSALTGLEKMEFQTYYLAPGREQGLSTQRIEQDFLRDLAKRKQFNDEPMN